MKSQIVLNIIFCLLFLAMPQLAAAQATGLDIAAYDLSMRLDLEERGAYAPRNTLSATARITFTNRNESSITRVPVVLYRLLQVKEVRNDRAEALVFTQRLGVCRAGNSIRPTL